MAKQSTVAPVRGSRQTRRPVPSRKGSLPQIEWGIPLGTTNFMILGGGILLLVIGYLLMGTGVADNPLKNDGVWNNAAAVTIAPILLGLGYCVVIPFALLYRPKRKQEGTEETDGTAGR